VISTAGSTITTVINESIRKKTSAVYLASLKNIRAR